LLLKKLNVFRIVRNGENFDQKCLIFCWPQPLKGDEHDVDDDDINDDVSDDVDKICIFD
jgi:hypothetical protein